MTSGTSDIQKDSRSHSAAWFAAAMGASIGMAALAYRRRPRSRWDRSVDAAGHLIQTARKEIKPWMGAAAGTAAAGTALALYMRRPRVTAWQQARKRAVELASRVGAQTKNPWANLAATAAVSLASVAYANRARRRTIRGIDARTADRINEIAEKGLRVLNRVRGISEQTAKLYARGRQAVA
jgi:hypothetical protein